MSDPVDPNLRPDLEESTNVAEAHAALEENAAAASREKRVRENGMEPVSLWVFLASALVLLVGGVVLGSSDALFNYSDHPVGYVQAIAPGGGDTGPITGPIMVALSKNGSKIYSKCSGCHQPDGLGDGANYPPLGGSEWVTGDTQAFAMILLNGLKGEVEVAGRTWNSNMPAQMPLSAAELASVMTYVRNSFGNSTGDVVSVAQAQEALNLYKERMGGASLAPQVTQAELKSDHAKMLPGEEIAADVVVDFETLEPVQAATE